MLYLSLFCLNLSYKSLDVYNSGGGVVPNSDVYKYSDPCSTSIPSAKAYKARKLMEEFRTVSFRYFVTFDWISHY